MTRRENLERAAAEMAAVLKNLISTGFPVQDEYGFEHHAISRAQQGRAHAALAAYNLTVGGAV
jgi:hypothetical protein